MYAHFALLGLASIGVALGYRYRLSIIAFFFLFTYVELIDKTLYLNHYYWMSLVSFLMVFMPLHRMASLDARRAPIAPTVPVWVVWALRVQVGVVYLFAGIAKLDPDWLLQAQPLRIWLYNSGDLPLIGPMLKEAWVAFAMSWTGAFFDLTIVGWLLWRRSRPIAFAVLAVFHVMTWLLFPIGMFPWVMIAAAAVFFPADWPHRLPLLRRLFGQPAPPDRERVSLPDWKWRAMAAGLALFAIMQIALPLRHLAYSGNVRWNEEGCRFAWRVMLTEKTGHASFRVTDPASGQEWLAYPGDYLTPLQAERMAYQPDMLLATARMIADDSSKKGRPGVEVRADAFVAFNGRRAVRLIDPEVGLAHIELRGIGPKPWALPAPDGD